MNIGTHSGCTIYRVSCSVAVEGGGEGAWGLSTLPKLWTKFLGWGGGGIWWGSAPLPYLTAYEV